MTTEEFNHIIAPMRGELKAMAAAMTGDDSLAEDIVQEVMLKMWSMGGALDRYENKRGLAVTMLKNKIADHRRHTRIERELPARMAERSAQEPKAEAADEAEMIRLIVDHLPPLQERLFRMKEIEGYGNEEIMQITGCTPESLRQNLSRARRKIIADFAKLTRMRIKKEQPTEEGGHTWTTRNR